MKLPDVVQCPYCKSPNRLGRSICRKCMRPVPTKESVIAELEKMEDEVKDKSGSSKDDKPSFRFNLDLEE